ncbi:DUF6944 family repetitive protein [Metabacillus iocasae]|uniref:Uncharacterized protein n=1 Tax=Priestia iocasae TaxID=2291674 RepID=A0ABS2QS83_9BACI|nr:hypothetical protein [Metabacillus iocasae]MBM7702078.1 hypothetical protein [Metabacillus iocasae]
MGQYELLGAWITATGNVTAAIGATRELMKSSRENEQIIILGNGLQALGSSLQINEPPGEILESLGSKVQITGNLSVIAGVIGGQREELIEYDILIVIGDSLQGIGAGLEVINDLQNVDTNQPIFLEVVGNSLQSIGAFIQALSGAYQLGNEQRIFEIIGVTGSWIQATGAVIEAFKEAIRPHSPKQQEQNPEESKSEKEQDAYLYCKF